MRWLACSVVLVLLVAACGGSTPHYVGNPRDMQNACTRAATVCPVGDDWIACGDDRWECYRLGLWYEDGIKVPRAPARARRIFESMCDRFEMSSCQKLCEAGDAKRCVDLALLGIAGAGGRPFPPSYTPRDRATFDKACSAGDDVACAIAELRYTPRAQPVVARMNYCEDDHARCFAAACDDEDPLGCALLCHVGERRACEKLAALAASGSGFQRALPNVASALLGATADPWAKAHRRWRPPSRSTTSKSACSPPAQFPALQNRLSVPWAKACGAGGSPQATWRAAPSASPPS